MNEADFSTIMDRLLGLYPKWKPTTEQRAWLSGKVAALHQNDVIGAIDAMVLDAKTTYAPNIGEIVRRGWANKQARTGETHSEQATESPIDTLRRVFNYPQTMQDGEVVARCAAADIRTWEKSHFGSELDTAGRWRWIYGACLRAGLAIDERVYWADRWAGVCPEAEAKARADHAAVMELYERGGSFLELIQMAMPKDVRMTRAQLDANRRQTLATARKLVEEAV